MLVRALEPGDGVSGPTDGPGKLCRALGITDFGEMKSRGFSRAAVPAHCELFFNHRPMTLARWPNEGYVKIVQALGPTPVNVRGTVGTVEGIFSYDGDRPARWAGEEDIMLHGFWFWDWADQRQKVLSIDAVSHVITLAAPPSFTTASKWRR